MTCDKKYIVHSVTRLTDNGKRPSGKQIKLLPDQGGVGKWDARFESSDLYRGWRNRIQIENHEYFNSAFRKTTVNSCKISKCESQPHTD